MNDSQAKSLVAPRHATKAAGQRVATEAPGGTRLFATSASCWHGLGLERLSFSFFTLVLNLEFEPARFSDLQATQTDQPPTPSASAAEVT